MVYQDLQSLTIATFLEQLGFDHDLVGQFRSGIDRVTAVMDDYERHMSEIETGKHQTNAERDARAQGLTEKTLRRLNDEETQLAGYDQHMARFELFSGEEVRRRQTEIVQVRKAHQEAVQAAANVVQPAEDPLVGMAR